MCVFHYKTQEHMVTLLIKSHLLLSFSLLQIWQEIEKCNFRFTEYLHFFLDYRHNGRDLQSSTLSVPEQVMSSNHCSRSGSPHRGDSIGRTRSWSPSVPPPQR